MHKKQQIEWALSGGIYIFILKNIYTSQAFSCNTDICSRIDIPFVEVEEQQQLQQQQQLHPKLRKTDKPAPLKKELRCKIDFQYNKKRNKHDKVYY